MQKLYKDFLEELRSNLLNSSSIKTFMLKETFLKGKAFSFAGHEYQDYIVNLLETRQELDLCIGKNSQVGISEALYRYFLSKMKLKYGVNVLVSFPSFKASSEIFQTRVDPIIQESPRLKGGLMVDSAYIKQFSNGSTAYALSGGSAGSSSLITRPISDILIDELDRQDPTIYNSYDARTTHTEDVDRVVCKVSTFTAPDIGIDAEINSCRERHIPLTICEHCGHQWEPDFWVDVKVPGWEKLIESLTKEEASELDLSQAYLQCPECLGKCQKRDYTWTVQYNETGTKNKVAVVLNPFIAPKFIKMSDLVKALLKMDRVEFTNQKLGKTAKLEDSTIDTAQIQFITTEEKFGRYILGLDMGKVCHLFWGVQREDSSIHVMGAEILKLLELDARLEELTKRHVFSAMVMDANPFADKVYTFVRKYSQMYSAIYSDPTEPWPEQFRLKMTDKHDELVRQVEIQKNVFMDAFAQSLPHAYTFEPTPLEHFIKQHFKDMRRVKDYEKSIEGGDTRYKWVKSERGADHFFHAGVYLHMAARLATVYGFKRLAIPVVLGKIKLPN